MQVNAKEKSTLKFGNYSEVMCVKWTATQSGCPRYWLSCIGNVTTQPLKIAQTQLQLFPALYEIWLPLLCLPLTRCINSCWSFFFFFLFLSSCVSLDQHKTLTSTVSRCQTRTLGSGNCSRPQRAALTKLTKAQNQNHCWQTEQ